MDPTGQILTAVGVWIVATLLPLVPAIVIYKLFPDTKVAAQGPLSGLTLRASGAFAAYIVVFALTIHLTYRVMGLVESNVAAVWNVRFKVDLVGPKGQRLQDNTLMDAMQISQQPQHIVVAGGSGWAKVAETERKLPRLIFTVPLRGSTFVDLQERVDRDADVTVDKAKREIVIQSPITVRVHEDTTPYGGGTAASLLPITGTLPPPSPQ